MTAYAYTGAGLTVALVLAAPGVAQASWDSAGSGAAAARATGVPSAERPALTADGSSVLVDWPAAEIVPGRSVTGYRVVRYGSGSDVAVAVGAGCSGLLTTTRCTETGVPDGDWQYAVRAVHRSWTGPLSPLAAVSIRTVVTPAAVGVTFPAAAVRYGPSTWAKTCQGFCGTASASTGNALTKVELSVRQAGGSYWNGSGFSATAEQLIRATLTPSGWQLPFAIGNFPAADAGYVVRVVATDSSGATATTTTAFTIDRKGPVATDIQANNGDGAINAGDRLVLSFDEEIDPASIKSGWDGTALPVTVVNTAGGSQNDRIEVRERGTTRALTALGAITLSDKGYVNSATNARLAVVGKTVVLTFDASTGTGSRKAEATMTWVPADVTDPLGNAATDLSRVSEAPPADAEF